MVDPIDVFNEMIAKTVTVSNRAGFPEDRFGVGLGIGFRLQILNEVRSALLLAWSRSHEDSAESRGQDR